MEITQRLKEIIKQETNTNIDIRTRKREVIELVNKFDGDLITAGWGETAFIDSQKCALIAVEEVLYILNEIDSTEEWNASWFYNEVKQEIEKL